MIFSIRGNIKVNINSKSKVEQRTNSSLALPLIVVLLFGTFRVLPTSAADCSEIYLVPSSISPDLKWSVTAWIKDLPTTNPAFAYQIALFFNTSLFECTGAWIPQTHKTWVFSGSTTVSPVSLIDNAKGFAVVGDAILIGESVSGSGPFSLAIFEFDVKVQPQLNPLSYVNISDPDTYLLNEDLEDILPIRKQNSCPDSVWSSMTGEQQVCASSPPSEFGYASDGMKWGVDSLREGSFELIVGLSDIVSDTFAEFASLAEENEVNIVDTISAGGEIVAAVVKSELQTMSSYQTQLRRSGLSRYMEPNYKVKALMEPNDPKWAVQWGPQKIQADFAWNTTTGNHSILVAVADTGIDYTHEDLSPNYNASGYDWINDDTDPLDDYGHGTHCAGIIAAAINNSAGIAGLAQVQIMSEKCLDDLGWGSLSDVANAVYHATDNGARIISMSLGTIVPTSTLYNAIKYAYNNDVLLIASTGNDNTSMRHYPAAYDEVVAVVATDENDNKAWFSNWGDWIELSAPGVDIYSTMPTYHVTLNKWKYGGYRLNYDYMDGTSMAAPHVSGVAALIMNQYPNMTRDMIRYQLRWTAVDLDPGGFDETYGWGRINARSAVEEGRPDHDLGIIKWKAPSSSPPGQAVCVNTTVLNFGLNDEYNVRVELKINDTTVDYDEVSMMQSGATYVFNTSWTPSANGISKMDSIVLPVTGENRTSNNIYTAPLIVRFPTTLYVPQNYTSIQSAVDAAIAEDIIQVSNGTYYERLIIDKAISILGQDKYTTMINGYGESTTVHVNEDNVTISGFTIQNSSTTCILLSSSWNNITDNIIKTCTDGIRVVNSKDTEIHNNIITQCSSEAIYMVGGDRYSITNNTLVDNCYGIFSWGLCDNNTIYKNYITSNIGGGIIDLQNYNTSIIENKITSNGYDGVAINQGERFKIKDNFLMGNGWASTEEWEYFGLFICIMTDTSIYHNTVINNTNQVLVFEDSPSVNWSGRWNVTGNYWSDYTGNDTDSDGIGEEPYIIKKSQYVPDHENHTDCFPFMNPYLPGDITHDGQVDMRDIGRIARAYGTEPGDPDWNPKADLTEDAVVDDQDLDIATANYGKTWQDYWGID